MSNGGGSVTIPNLTDSDSQSLNLNGNTLSISNGNSITLPNILPQTISQSGNTLTLSNGGGSVTLAGFIDTDAQALTLNGNTLSISNGNSVILPNTIPQTISQAGNVVTLSNGGGSFTLPSLGSQTISQTGNTITLSNGGGSFTLPTMTDTDAQSLTLTGNTLSISNGNTITLPATSVSAGTNTSVTGSGTTASPYVISSVDTSIYANNGTINSATTTAGNRVVTMNNNNLWFKSVTGDTNGKIYVGNTATYPTTTGSYKLFVEGGIMTEKVKVALRSSSNWADYVFNNNYKLMPLQEVAKYVEANKHLPGIDSASELAEKGLDIAEMQAKHMEKIEELTLYIIDQDKRIETQNKAIENNTKEIEVLKAQLKVLIDKTK